MKRKERYALLLLAGGKSSRMGQDKALLLYEGKTFMDQLLHKAQKLGIQKKYLSGHISSGEATETVKDRYRERGPLGGLHAGLLAAETPYCLVLPVDVPQIPEQVLEELVNHHEGLLEKEKQKPLLLEHGGRTEPLIGIYPAEMAGFMEKEIKDGAVPVFRVLDKWGYRKYRAKLPQWQTENINTPEAYEDLLRHQEGSTQAMKEGILLEEAAACIREQAGLITETEEVEVWKAGGHCLAEDVYARLDNPPFSRSPVDGYAVCASDLKGSDKEHPVCLTVTGCIYAGDDTTGLTVQKGEAMRIMTGAPFPRGSDTAVRQEDTDYGEKNVRIYREQKPYDNYCSQGEDYKKGSLLLKKGCRITFAEQGILSGNGYTRVTVYRKPVIRIFTTGDELCPPGTALLPGKIYDSNGMMVGARVRELGIEPKSVSHAADSARELAQILKNACEDADIVITTGGVSVGKKDILHDALDFLGAEKIFWRVLLQPGTPTIFSVYNKTLLLSLSGNPFGAMANVELLLRPALEAMTGDAAYSMEEREGILKNEFPKSSRVRRFVRARYQDGGVFLPEGIFSSGAMGTLRGCNCLLDIPAGSQSLRSGERVRVWML